MTRAQKNGQMAKAIQEAWKLTKAPILGTIKVEQIGKNKITEVRRLKPAPVPASP